MAETEAALRTLAHNVRTARTRAGLSLDELGRRAKVSKGALVGLEKAQGNPNFATLVRLADTLGVSVSALLEGPSEGRVRVVAADAVMPLWTGAQGSEARLMLTTSGTAPVEVWRWKLEPGEEYPSHPHQAGVVETVSVTAGRMNLIVDGAEHTVEVGQTATFDGDAPHTYRGAGTEPCHLIMTVHLPPGPVSTS
ncbi:MULTISPECIES: helix-turn-helix domain-containing protein [Streptomyces]|jgi:transcriptional regulator with XRE-family HTH domain|uniref:XRE family transcriptional regulator n=1 Tax=Streptomyces mirabilis TaxID=68239 RepID=A0ABU3UBG7_9ACTN|nr:MULTISPECIES: XRE family transcriptional regulator [Streptomyces]KPI01000.1 Cupin 2 conserved barrel domain protein [Actinobacteria bacterium OK006]KAF5990324.1 XRE family transcriptional regulator [Streptomyces sp. WAC00263]MCX4418486.1 XRE family transcriptional regulator [Streptomyces mirabilis]MCX4616935.1 XRE family transcriptional regulator [Streptomyces mirabilis]MCX5355164.1 XRE family transcriptional regulator [Streptomyces mirabilis]